MEAAVIGEKHLAVVVEVIAHLSGGRDGCNLAVERLHFNGTTRRFEAPKRSVFRGALQLVGSEETAIWNSRTTVGKLDKDSNLWLQLGAESVQQVGQRRVT